MFNHRLGIIAQSVWNISDFLCDVLHTLYRLYICTTHKLWNRLDQPGHYYRFLEQSIDRSSGSGAVMDALLMISTGVITRQLYEASPNTEIKISNPFKRLLDLRYCASGMWLDMKWLSQNYDIMVNSLMIPSVVHVNHTIKKRHLWASNRDYDDVIRRIGYKKFDIIQDILSVITVLKRTPILKTNCEFAVDQSPFWNRA